MRQYININRENELSVFESLRTMISSSTTVQQYRMAQYNVGLELGALIRHEFEDVPDNEIMFTVSSEDADWLGRGVLKGLRKVNVRVSAFWNGRVNIENAKKRITVAPIIKSYEEPVEGCKYLIIVKSIINTSCVVKTQLTRMIGKFNPDRIMILSPVSYIGAENSLKEEFPKSISSKFSFFCFAVDDERDGDVVIPGVGGLVYSRLGFRNVSERNAYIPGIVRERVASQIAFSHRVSTVDSRDFQESTNKR